MSGPPEQRPTLPTPDGTLLPPEELRRRVYLLALAAGLIVLTIVFAVGNFQGRTDVYTGVLVPALTIMVLFSTGWLLARRSVPFIERAVFICMNVAHLAQILEQTLGPDPNTLASNDAPYWMLVTVCMVAHLIYRPRIAGLYSAAAYLLSCALPLGGLLLTAQPVSAELVRVQLTAGITLVFVHALSWYRGQFEAQREASLTIGGLSLVSFGMIFVLLFTRYRSVRLALIIMAGVPMALVGSVIALGLAGLPLSVASMIGFVTLTGIASRNGILKVSHYINLVLHEGEIWGDAMIVRGTLERLTPVLMTALAAGLALTPLLIGADEPGKEILHPVAVTIFGGLLSATLLDALITPILFRLFGRAPLERIITEARQSGNLQAY